MAQLIAALQTIQLNMQQQIHTTSEINTKSVQRHLFMQFIIAGQPTKVIKTGITKIGRQNHRVLD